MGYSTLYGLMAKVLKLCKIKICITLKAKVEFFSDVVETFTEI